MAWSRSSDGCIWFYFLRGYKQLATAAAGNKLTVNPGSKRRIKMWMMFIVLFMGWAAYTFFGQIQQQNATELRLAAVMKQKEDATNQAQQLNRKLSGLTIQNILRSLQPKSQGMVKEGEQQIFRWLNRRTNG